MTTSRIIKLAALVVATVLAGCGRDEQKASAQELAPAEAEYRAKIDEVNAERKRFMTEMTEAQKSGDSARMDAAADALIRNRKKAADLVQSHMNLKSSKEQNK